jgi:hypothetical protein
MWKYQLQQFVNRTRLEVSVSRFPPGASKWNKVEHRLFCYITKNWQGQPLIDVQTAIDLIGTTRTTAGLTVICVRDDTEYKFAQKASDEDFAAINLVKIPHFESWNYRILHQWFVHVIVEQFLGKYYIDIHRLDDLYYIQLIKFSCHPANKAVNPAVKCLFFGGT